MQESIRDAAFNYLQFDLPLIPICSHKHQGMSSAHKEMCTCSGKTPILKAWTRIKTTTPEELEEWFTSWPSMNIGLVLGETQDWNIVAIDIDGEKGLQYFEQLTRGKELPATVEFVTGGGGYRLLYTLPPGIVTKKQKLYADTDHNEVAFLVTGQQTILPPSRHQSGNKYEWIEGKSIYDVDIAPAPTWIVNIVTAHSQPEGPEGFSKKVTEDEIKQEIPAGNRSNQLARLVGSYVKKLKGSPIEIIYDIAYRLNETYCKPPLDRADVEKMVGSIYTSEQNAPTKQKGSKAESMDCKVVAEGFVLEQQNEGIEYRYDDIKEMFYTTAIEQGPWRPVTIKSMEDFVVNKYLNDNYYDNTISIRKEIVAQIKSYLYYNFPKVNFEVSEIKETHMIVVNDGIFNSRTGELELWDPRKYNHNVRINACWKIVDEEQYNRAKRMWEEALGNWLPDKECALFLQEYIGYAMTPKIDQRAAVFLFGRGANGKSLFIDSILPLFKGFTAVTDPITLSKRFGTDNLIDKLLVQCADIDSKYMEETGRLKNLIAGDEVQVEIKGGAKFNLRPACKMLFSANELPKTSDKSEGWYSRMRFVPFPNQFKQDPVYSNTLKSIMHSEAGRTMLLHWAMEGLRRLTEHGKFTDSKAMQAEVHAYKLDNDSLLAFVEEVLIEVDPDPSLPKYTQCILIKNLYSNYVSWCKDKGLKSIGSTLFSRRLTSMGYDVQGVRMKQKSHWTTCRCLCNMQYNLDSEDGSVFGRDYEAEMQLLFGTV